ncbi:helix-turn-helix domain-containing protein [Desulfovibrio sp. OttesenSCG-928-O18]|nr:helix-turn-helix domain-containing protein [Desulfovibrio sp. OttesenSCG-928-O18]
MTNSKEPALLTIAELARNLDLPESTTRYYCNRFAAHLPSVGEGRRRRYKPEALEKLRTIAQTMRRDKNAYAVDLVLRNEEGGGYVPGPVPVAVSPEAAFAGSAQFVGQVMSLMENQTRALQDIATAMGVFAERLSFAPGSAAVPPSGEEGAGESHGAASVSGEEVTALREELTALRDQMRASESVHQNDLEQLRKWLTRLGEALAAK